MGRTIEKIAELASAAFLATAITFLSHPITIYYLSKQEDEDIKEYVETSIDTIISDQEEELGIKYRGKPEFGYQLPEAEELITQVDKFLGKTLGLYYSNEKVIYLRSGILTLPDTNIEDVLATIFTWGRTSAALPVISHELAHYYTDRRGEELTGLEGWQRAMMVKMYDPEQQDALDVVEEGIATYIQNRVHPHEDWERSDLTDKYAEGFDFVKPIIDRFGSRGIDYLIVNIPSPREIASPEIYQRRAITKLEHGWIARPQSNHLYSPSQL